MWTRSEEVSQHTALPLALLAGGYLLAGLMTVPYALQLAAGLTHIQLRVNLLSVIVVVPLIVGSVQAVGVAGAGVGWLTVNLLQWLVIPHFLHASVLSGERARWLARDTLPYVCTSFIAFFPFALARAQLVDLVHPAVPVVLALAVYACASWILWRRHGGGGALLRRLAGP